MDKVIVELMDNFLSDCVLKNDKDVRGAKVIIK